jgi:SpoVK/Ycf46/Vps4 family AAA+-type ATPase
MGTFDPPSSSNMVRQHIFQKLQAVRMGRDSDVSFEAFPYYLSESTKSTLLMLTFMHLKGAQYAKYVAATPFGTSSRILLTGPLGSDIFQETLVKALAKHYDVKYLVCLINEPALCGCASSQRPLKEGDIVIFKGPSGDRAGDTPGFVQGSRGPLVGRKGRVVDVLRGRNIVAAQFDSPVSGNNISYFAESELEREGATPGATRGCRQEMIDALFEVLDSESTNSPFILFLKNAENLVGDERFKDKLNRLRATVVVIASHAGAPEKKPKHKETSQSGLVKVEMLRIFGKAAARSEPIQNTSVEMLSKLFPCRVTIQAPHDEEMLSEWNLQLGKDMETVKSKSNITMLQLALDRSNLHCEDLESVIITDQALTKDSAAEIVKWALYKESLTHEKDEEPPTKNQKLILSADSLREGMTSIQEMQIKPSSSSHRSSKHVVPANDFEKRLLADVIPPKEIGVSFEDIGASETLKEALKELVMLPLQRPELFSRGQLMRPCKGVMLFGPPGTGKTMLAKAVASEAGASFINISLSSIASKWYGEGEQYVKAIFTLASKMSPSVIFVDEVDSMLCSRHAKGEHEASRKIKTEFMTHWDGLLTKEKERVLVLAATNRPFDLDEAIIRRLPRRLFVNLPDRTSRAKILKVTLAKEEISKDVDLDELAGLTEGYSGSDLKNLCVVAAHGPVREILEKEKTEGEIAKVQGMPPPPLTGSDGVPVSIRALNMQDLRKACQEVSTSVAADGTMMRELVEWNKQYGEGGSRKKSRLSYYM